MKKLLSTALMLILAVSVVVSCVSCSENSATSNNSNDTSVENSEQTQQSTTSQSSVANSSVAENSTSGGLQLKPLTQAEYINVDNTAQPRVQATAKSTGVKIFLAGDSTVKTYTENQFIAGWGQYLQNYLSTENVTVVNKSNGGRSTRSFINEGRLYTYSSVSYSDYTSIESEISNGDYLMIQFGHNDDDSQNAVDSNMIERKVPIGTADASGIYPTTIPTKKMSKEHIPEKYIQYADTLNKQSMINEAYLLNEKYGSYSYSYDCGGTFKGYLKMYIDFARAKGAIPILVTPVTRVSFDATGKTIIPAIGKHGANLEYVEAVRQIASEENCLLIDLYADTKSFMEATEKTESDLLMALKSNALMGEWPTKYDELYTTRVGVSGIEGTHYNKYGAFITAAKVAEHFKTMSSESTTGISGETINFSASVLEKPTTAIVPSTLIKNETIAKIKALFTKVSLETA